jgi:hypothetical protein
MSVSEDPPVSIAYLPAHLTEQYDKGPCVAVVHGAEAFARCLGAPAPGVEWLQVEGLIGDPDVWALAAQGTVPIPLDVILDDPAMEFSALYRLADVRLVRSVQVTMPAKPGLLKALRLAVSLQIPVRLLPGQPDHPTLAELQEAARFYLCNPMVATPIEFFHSLLATFQGQASGTLWRFLDQDPAIFSRLDDSGRPIQSADFVESHLARLIAEGAECAACPWVSVCAGYFKWPDPAYGCAGVKELFAQIAEAGEEMARDLVGHAPHDPL